MKAFQLFCLVLLLATPVWADSIYVAPVQGTNVPQQQGQTVRELIKVEVQNRTDHTLADSLKNSQYYLQTKLINFNSYTLSITRWQGKKKLNSGQWKAKDLAELEKVIPTAIGEVLSGRNSGSSQKVFTVNEKSLGERAMEKNQQANFERVQARRQVIVGFGPAYFSKMNSPQSGLGFQAGYIWNIDDHFDLGLKSDFAISTKHSDAYTISGKIVTNYFFTRTDISPFVGLGFGYGWASVHNGSADVIPDDNSSGFAGSIQGGVKFFRTSTVNFVVSGEYTQIFDDNSLGQPGIFLLKVGLLY